MKRHVQRTLTVVDDPGPHATILRFAAGKQIVGDADEDYVCGNCATVLCMGVTEKNFAGSVFIACWSCGKVNALATTPRRARLTPHQELEAATTIAEDAYRVARQQKRGPPVSDLFCVVMNAGTKMGATAAMCMAVNEGQAFEAAERTVKRALADSPDPLLGATVNLPLLRALLAAAGAPHGAPSPEKGWLEETPGHDELRVVVISSTIRVFTIQGGAARHAVPVDRSKLN